MLRKQKGMVKVEEAFGEEDGASALVYCLQKNSDKMRRPKIEPTTVRKF